MCLYVVVLLLCYLSNTTPSSVSLQRPKIGSPVNRMFTPLDSCLRSEIYIVFKIRMPAILGSNKQILGLKSRYSVGPSSVFVRRTILV